jgi:hypothetical protein
MILDNFLMFDPPAAPAALAQVAGTYISGNTIDLHMAGIPVLANLQGARDMGVGDSPALKMLVQVSTAFTSGGAATLQVALQGATDNGSGAPNTFVTWWTSPAYALATIAVAGARLYDMDMPRPPAGVAVPRFLRMAYIIGGATTTAGGIVSGIVLDRMDQMYQSTGNGVMGGYPAGLTVAN